MAKVFVVLASTKWDEPNEKQTYGLKNVEIHPKHNPTSKQNDIALLVLDRDIDFSTGEVEIVKLNEFVVNEGSKVFLTGWGLKWYNDKESPSHLQGISLNISAPIQCFTSWMNIYQEYHLCTDTGYSKYGTCNMDSGSPLVNEKGIQVAVVSFGQPCATGTPDVHTAVAYFLDFIDKIIQENQ